MGESNSRQEEYERLRQLLLEAFKRYVEEKK
jgi:hypothetical protein